MTDLDYLAPNFEVRGGHSGKYRINHCAANSGFPMHPQRPAGANDSTLVDMPHLATASKCPT